MTTAELDTQNDVEYLDATVAAYFEAVEAWKATQPPPKRMRRTFQIESSQFSPFARWVPGAEIYEEDCTVEYPAALDHLDTDALDQMADNNEGGVRYVDPNDTVELARQAATLLRSAFRAAMVRP